MRKNESMRVMVFCDCDDCPYLEKETYYAGGLIKQKTYFLKCKKLGLYWKWDDFFNVYDYCPLPKYDKLNKNGKEMRFDE